MTGDACLMVLNPRRIPSCIAAIEALDIPTCWLSYMSELHVADAFNLIVECTSFARYVLLSDDAEPTPQALEKVLELHDENARTACTTAYCNLDSHLPHVNLTRNPLPPPPPQVSSYDLLTQADVDAFGDYPFTSTFAGFSLTCLSRTDWLRFPLAVTSLGGQMDYSLSYRLQQAGVVIVTHRDARVHHVKERWNAGDMAPEKRLLVGQRPPEIRWT